MKPVLFFFIVFALPFLLWATPQDSVSAVKDTVVDNRSGATDALNKKDSSTVQAIDTIAREKDTSSLQFIISNNKLLNSKGKPVSLAVKIHKDDKEDALFYLLAAVVLLLACFKFFFNRYFTNLFRVFFNTSLRQSQLTDQLLQAKLPSLLFNIFFIISGGLYVYFLLFHYQWITAEKRWTIMALCIGVMTLIYIVKFSTLKFTGWITGYTESTDTYVFVIFLINKIIGICLMPLTIIIAFAQPAIATSAALISVLCVGLLLLMRFFRSYSLIHHQLKISRLHFLLYIVGVEILPLLLIYKALILLLNKNL